MQNSLFNCKDENVSFGPCHILQVHGEAEAESSAIFTKKYDMNAPQTTIQTEIPTAFLSQAQNLADAGWFRNLDGVMLDALRRFLASHGTELMEQLYVST